MARWSGIRIHGARAAGWRKGVRNKGSAESTGEGLVSLAGIRMQHKSSSILHTPLSIIRSIFYSHISLHPRKHAPSADFLPQLSQVSYTNPQATMPSFG
jgi:hypothetical protein